jgi:rRNA maturation endonuclease Nob1
MGYRDRGQGLNQFVAHEGGGQRKIEVRCHGCGACYTKYGCGACGNKEVDIVTVEEKEEKSVD